MITDDLKNALSSAVSGVGDIVSTTRDVTKNFGELVGKRFPTFIGKFQPRKPRRMRNDFWSYVRLGRSF